ncbi:MAG: endoglucanase-related protein glycoside hydrolase family 9 protein [Fibrobacterota bacterium]|jgi:hypothetical protein
MRKLLLSICALVGLAATASEAQKFAPADYKKALWMTTRFYGGQRSGHGPNWLLMDHKYKVSYVRDSADGRDLVGGWMDCGDFPLFGQTFFYSTYALLQAYDAFPTGFPDQYHGFDYSDYAAAQDFTYASSKPDGIPDLLQEVKYATDWIIKATPDEKTFYFQKGTGGNSQDAKAPKPYGEHGKWVTSGYYSAEVEAIDGGEFDEGRPIFKLGKSSGLPGEVVVNDGSMPSFAAAALALMSIHYRKYDPAYADSCLAHARIAFAYAKTQTGNGGTGMTGYYGANAKLKDDFVTAGSCMYKATGEQTFKDFAVSNKVFTLNKGYTLSYSDNDDMAMYTGWKFSGMADYQDSLKRYFADRYKSKGTGESGLSTLGDKWGFLRYPANQAFICGLYSKAASDTSYDGFIYNQVDYIMGANPPKQAFIVGFCSGCSKTADWPHHRNVYLDDRNNPKAVKGIPVRNKEFGYMLGFTNKIADSLNQYIDNYTQTEGGIDYNAGLVGALAYINSKLNPVDTAKLGQVGLRERGARGPAKLLVRSTGDGLAFSAPFQKPLARVVVSDMSGRMVAELPANATESVWNAPSGTWIVRATTVSGESYQAVVPVAR